MFEIHYRKDLAVNVCFIHARTIFLSIIIVQKKIKKFKLFKFKEATQYTISTFLRGEGQTLTRSGGGRTTSLSICIGGRLNICCSFYEFNQIFSLFLLTHSGNLKMFKIKNKISGFFC